MPLYLPKPNLDTYVSYRLLDAKGQIIACIYAENPKHENSCRYELDAQGQLIACIYAENPKNENSWRKAQED